MIQVSAVIEIGKNPTCAMTLGLPLVYITDINTNTQRALKNKTKKYLNVIISYHPEYSAESVIERLKGAASDKKQTASRQVD